MALDEPKETDEVIKENGVTYLIEKTLLEKAKPITVDFMDGAMGSGFSINSSMSSAGGSACGSGCSC